MRLHLQDNCFHYLSCITQTVTSNVSGFKRIWIVNVQDFNISLSYKPGSASSHYNQKRNNL